jgi:hypothetical protein
MRIKKCMFRIIVLLFVLTTIVSCSNKDNGQPPVVIPDNINGPISEVMVTPVNITTPDKGSLVISMNNVNYKVEFNAVAQSQSNATLSFVSDTIIRDDSRAFANLGVDVVAYNPVGPNEITIRFTNGNIIFGWFDGHSSFGGTFGQALISTWATPGDPAKPNQKAKSDISKFVGLYKDSDGPGPTVTPIYLLVQVSKQ